MKKDAANLAQLSEFDEFIDARSPAEYAADHIPGALSCPVLDDEQRAIVGTLYKQESPFKARKLGGAMVAENIARHLRDTLADKPKDWRPLVYCWRGGQRSGAFATWLRMVGWDACQLEGGYKRWRHHVVDELNRLPPTLDLRVLCGPTGSAKTRILEALTDLGEQVIDLEALARHKGSVLGALPGQPQPSQKWFESCLHDVLSKLDPARPVFIEAESRKIGRIHVPDTLLLKLRSSTCFEIEAGHAARIDYLVRDYAYLADDVDDLLRRIDYLRELQSKETLSRWKTLAVAQDLPTLYAEFIDLHYDPLYRRSQNRNFTQFASARKLATDDLSAAGIATLAREIHALAG